jgi:hypothetical protein
VVTEGGGDAGGPGQAQDEMARLQAGHDAGPAAGADPGTVFVEVDGTQCRRSSMPQWPRMIASSWAWLAWVMVNLAIIWPVPQLPFRDNTLAAIPPRPQPQ